MRRGKIISGHGKRVSEDTMNTSALSEAKGWYDRLLDAEWKERRDREATVRYRLARRLGISESYAFRLQYKFEEMTDIRGSVYRALMLANGAYERACQINEDAADRIEAERAALRGNHEATAQKLSPKSAPENDARH